MLVFFLNAALAQADEKPFIRLTAPLKEESKVTSSQQFIVGSTCKTCNLMINGERVKVYATGAFAHELLLREGDSSLTMVAISEAGKSASKRLKYNYEPPKPAEPVKEFDIESIRTFPEGDLILSPKESHLNSSCKSIANDWLGRIL